MTLNPSYPVSVAPMIDKTDRYFRQMMRLLTKHTLLYTEMIAAAAIIHGDRHRLLDFDSVEKPLSLQIGTGSPEDAARAVKIAQDWDFDEINLNVGCPSDRVQSGEFGACLMAEPQRVAAILEAMKSATDKPVTVKHRIGIRSQTRGVSMETYEELVEFVRSIQPIGVQRYTVHARIAILEGLSPKENRDIPPLRYSEVYRLKQDFPELAVEINGGIKTHGQIAEHLNYVDAVMLGRAAYDDPYLFSEMDTRYFNSTGPVPTRREVIEQAFELLEAWHAQGQNARNLVWPILELFAGLPGTRKWKRMLSQPIPPKKSVHEFLSAALDQAPERWLDVRGIDVSAT